MAAWKPLLAPLCPGPPVASGPYGSVSPVASKLFDARGGCSHFVGCDRPVRCAAPSGRRARLSGSADASAGFKICDGMASRSSDLADLVSAPKRCPFCPSTFRFQGNLAQHVKRFHAERLAFLGPSAVAPAGTAGTPGRAPFASTPLGPPSSGGPHPPSTLLSATVTPDGGGEIAGSHAADGLATPTPVRAEEPCLGGSPLSVAAQVQQFFLAKGDMTRTRPLIPACKLGKPSVFVTPELKEMRMVALATGGHGMATPARKRYYLSVLRAERAAIAAHKRWLLEKGVALPAEYAEDRVDDRYTGRSSARTAKHTSVRQRRRRRSITIKRGFCGPVETAFPDADAFINALDGEQERCLSEQKWRVTDIVEDDGSYPFISRCPMVVAEDAVTNAEEVDVEGRAEYDGDGDRLRSGTLNSDLYLAEQASVRRIHDGRCEYRGEKLPAFVLAAQFFSDAAVVTDNGGTLRLWTDPVVSVFCCARNGVAVARSKQRRLRSEQFSLLFSEQAADCRVAPYYLHVWRPCM